MPSSPSTTARARARGAPARRSTGGWPTASSATWPCSSTRARPTSTTIRSSRFSVSPSDDRARPRRRAAPRPRRGRPGRHAPLVRRRPRRRGPARALSARVGRRARGATRREAGALPAGPAGRDAAPGPAPRPVVERAAERATRAWASGVDGSGSRALWILFEGGFGGAALCSLIVNDTAGMLEVAGGEITKRRLEAELAALRSSQKLPWVECDPARAVGLVAEALALHAAEGTAPPDAFARWRRLFDGAAAPAPPRLPAADPALVERSAALAELPEMAGWFLDPEAVQVDAVELLAARESRLVVSDTIKAEREDAIVGRVIARELGSEARRCWAR